uniref:Uncharacterized protein n=1 Tax=Bionectria ochroleuca TaxID=29856 RepID=A0A0B7JWS9_BIOOC
MPHPSNRVCLPRRFGWRRHAIGDLNGEGRPRQAESGGSLHRFLDDRSARTDTITEPAAVLLAGSSGLTFGLRPIR